MLEHHHFTGWSEDFNFVVHLGANYVCTLRAIAPFMAC